MDQLLYKIENIDRAFGNLKELGDWMERIYENANFGNKIRSLRSIFLLESKKDIGELSGERLANIISDLKKIAGEIEAYITKHGGVPEMDISIIRRNFGQFYDFLENANSGPPSNFNQETTLMELGKLEGRLRDLQDREFNISESINRLQASVERYETEKMQYFEELRGSLHAAMNENEQELMKNIDVMNDLYAQESEKLNQKSNDIDVLISVIGGKAISGGFIKNAGEEKKAADYFRWAAILLMLVVAGTLWNSINSHGLSLDPSLVALKIGFAVFSSFVVAYLVKQSALHRSQQHKYQQKAFDLSGINTYIATLPAPDQHALKMKIAEKIFVPPETLMAIEASGFGANELLGKLIDKLEIPAKSKTTP